jgi:hypothetical protein
VAVVTLLEVLELLIREVAVVVLIMLAHQQCAQVVLVVQV